MATRRQFLGAMGSVAVASGATAAFGRTPPHNYIAYPNPFGLSRPPQWWLNELWLFDNRLVILPGQKRMTYLLARRAIRSAGERLHDVPGLPQHPDTVLLHQQRCVRVCELAPGLTWDMRIFQKLAAHDIQRLGGPRAVADRLDAMDAKKAETIQRDEDTELTARASDGYKSYKMRIGERLSLVKTQPPGPHTPNPVSVAVTTPLPPAQPTGSPAPKGV